MRAGKSPEIIALHVAVFDDQIIARPHELVEMLQHGRDIVVGVFDHKPRMRLRTQEAFIEKRFGICAVAMKEGDERMLDRRFLMSTE